MFTFIAEVSYAVAVVVVLALHYLGILPAQFDVPLIALVALVGTAPVVWDAFELLRQGEWSSMSMLASIALVFSLVNGEWASASFIALMLCGARILESITEARTEHSIESLLELRPEDAKVDRGGTLTTVPLKDIVVGDVVVVDAGERIPVDGEVIKGDGAVDESTLTGESLPVDKAVGGKVYSSTLLQSGALTVRVSKIGKDTTLEKIVELIKSAKEERSEIATMGEKFGKIYLVVMILFSVGLLAVTHNPLLVLAVVLVVCADDVAIAIPLAYLNAIGVAARRGVIVKGGRHLEALGKATIYVFDKTGTLTRGTPHVTDVVPFAVSEQVVVAAAAAASGRSEHPLARAICKFAESEKIVCAEPEDAVVVGGRGIRARVSGKDVVVGNKHFLTAEGVPIEAHVGIVVERLGSEGKTTSLIAEGGKVIGVIALADEIKPNAKRALADLRALGAEKLIMLTGDNQFVAARVARELGLDEFAAGLLPEEKVTRIKSLAAEHTVVMVGDGVNDAAALTAATVGIAMGAIGYDSAIESAEIVLMRDDISKIPETVSLARRVRGVAVQDFWIWGVTNVLGLALVFGGFIGAPGAAAYNFVSDFFPLANSVRIRAWRR